MTWSTLDLEDSLGLNADREVEMSEEGITVAQLRQHKYLKSGSGRARRVEEALQMLNPLCLMTS